MTTVGLPVREPNGTDLPPPGPFWLAFDYELALESDRGGHVESVGRSGLHYLVDFFELLRG